uniref:RNA helicase n=1 Tax=Rhabditophanes sp. KR3021 TaxID=114890 RepID=A0AC35TT08_9BILA
MSNSDIYSEISYSAFKSNLPISCEKRYGFDNFDIALRTRDDSADYPKKEKKVSVTDMTKKEYKKHVKNINVARSCSLLDENNEIIPLMELGKNRNIEPVYVESWENYGIDGTLAVNLRRIGYAFPLEVQKCVIPLTKQKKHLFIHTSTGIGKTGAFLIPLIQKIANLNGEGTNRETYPTPRAIILCNSRNLANQTYDLTVQLIWEMNASCCKVVGEQSFEESKRYLKGGCDIIIATIGRLDYLVGANLLNLSKLENVILDEADSYVDDQNTVIMLKRIFEKLALHPFKPAARKSLIFPFRDVERLDRDIVIDEFQKNLIQILVTTDLLSRGIDFIGLNHVILYDLPLQFPSYVNRIGRTGRTCKGFSYSLIDENNAKQIKASKEIREALKEIGVVNKNLESLCDL